MIQFTATAGDGSGMRLIGLGLSEENIRQMQAGRPVRVDLQRLIPGLNVEVLIFVGADEDAMQRELAEHFEIRNVRDLRGRQAAES